jgi:uncharacterized membrane protein
VHRFLAAALAAGALTWSAALLVAPLALSSRHPYLAVSAALVYEAAGLVCHQRPERSFHLVGMPLPVCARCAGLYWSGAVVALVAVLSARRAGRPRHAATLLVVAALPTAATVGLEFLGLMFPTNMTRALSALPLGGAAAWVFVRSLLAERRMLGSRSDRRM